MTDESPSEPPTPLHPLLLVDDDLWSRLSVMVKQLCVGLVDNAARLHVLHAQTADLSDLLGPTVVAPIPDWWFPRRKGNLWGLLAKMPELSVNVIHLMGGRLFWAGESLHRRLGIPITAHVTSIDDVLALRKLSGIGGIQVMAISEPLRRLALKKTRMPEDRVHLVRPGMRSSAKGRISTGDRGVLTVFVWTRKKSVKSVETVFRALQKLLAEGRQILLFILGAGRAEDRLRKSVKSLGLRSRVTFVPEPHTALLGRAGEDVLILPQAPVELTLRTLGALAAGVVVVATGAGLHDCIRDGETALMYDRNDPDGLAAQLDRLLQDRPLARRLSDQGRAYVRENHQVSVMVEKVVGVYRTAIARSGAKPRQVASTT